MILAGLWFDVDKPTMATFLQPLMQEMNELYEKGTIEILNFLCYIMQIMPFKMYIQCP